MRAIIVDDEPIMIRRFVRLSEGIPDLHLVGQFESAEAALHYARNNPVDLAFLDIAMPVVNGIELAKKLRELRQDVLIVFISAYDEYLSEFNEIGGDYYIVKPYSRKIIEMAMDRIRLIAQRQQKSIYIQMFGRFTVFKNGEPLPLVGKAKEILALVATRRGKSISNEEIFSTLWENREYSNANMCVYYNAVNRLNRILKNEGMGDLLVSVLRGKMINTRLFDCDYYDWQDRNMRSGERFEGEFLPEYPWAESLLADIMNENEKRGARP